MERKPAPGRVGKIAFQAFVDPKVLARFRAACELIDKDRSQAVEEMMTMYAEGLGIPQQPPYRKPKKPNR